MTTLELEARLDNLLSTAQEETKDIDIFAPIPEREECPICLLPLPINEMKRFMTCCGKLICRGCCIKHAVADVKKGKPFQDHKCAFCRQPPIQTSKNSIKALKKLLKNNNSRALMKMSTHYKRGELGVMQSNTKSLEMLTKAAELGHADAFGKLGLYYEEGIAVEQDTSKALEFYTVAAKKGSLDAHAYLARFHGENENNQCIQHLKVLANAGDKKSMDALMGAYKEKLVSKDELTPTLRAFQASTNEMKSKDRENARLIDEACKRGEDPPFHLLV